MPTSLSGQLVRDKAKYVFVFSRLLRRTKCLSCCQTPKEKFQVMMETATLRIISREPRATVIKFQVVQNIDLKITGRFSFANCQ